MTPLLVQDWLCSVAVPKTTEGKRVTYPRWSAAAWSIEIEFLNPSRPGPRAAVRKVISELCGWRPVCSSCEKPENKV